MAGTDDNDTTSADDWRLANVELVFVTELVGFEKLAKELLFDGLEDGSIRWRCRELAVDESPDFSVNPPLVTSLAAARQFFWHRATHSRIDVDWPSYRAARVGPVIRPGSDGKGNNWPIFDLRGSATLKASLVRFHHGDVVNYLVALGLMPRPSTPAPQDTPRATPPPPLPPQEPTQPPFEGPKKWQPNEGLRWLGETMKKYPREPGESKNHWADRLYRDHMKKDFGEDIPWSGKTLRRRMSDV